MPLEMQSKECQKSHWKVVHKRECKTKSDQDPMQDPAAKAHLRDVSRWMNAWYLAMVVCVAISLDLANLEWGRHDTHMYASFDSNGQNYIF